MCLGRYKERALGSGLLLELMGNARSTTRYESGQENGSDLSDSAVIFKTNIERLEKKWVAENTERASGVVYEPAAATAARGGHLPSLCCCGTPEGILTQG